MSRAGFEALGAEELIKYLATQKVVLDVDEQGIFRKQKINGAALTVLSFDNLRAEGISAGVAGLTLSKIPQ